jgi:hypothetical protein
VPAVATAEGPSGFHGAREAELAMWEKLGAVVRLSYGIGKQRELFLSYILVQFFQNI